MELTPFEKFCIRQLPHWRHFTTVKQSFYSDLPSLFNKMWSPYIPDTREEYGMRESCPKRHIIIFTDNLVEQRWQYDVDVRILEEHNI